MDLHLAGKRVLITGASKGIGAAAAEAFAREGCHLRLAARDPAALSAVATRLAHEYGIEAETSAVDLRKPEDISRLAQQSPGVDILVNNAGDIPRGSLEELDETAWRHAWELKVFGYINLTRLLYAAMKARGGGVIVNTIGSSGERADFAFIAGSSGNAALMTFSRALGGRSLDDNIRVVGVNPGRVETERTVSMMRQHAKAELHDESRYRELMASLPRGRAAKPAEIADLIVFLASDRSDYTSGVIFTVDGGYGVRR